MRTVICVPAVILIFVLLLTSFQSDAEELHYYYRGARATAMGGAYVGLADDEQALFLNPAGLAGNDTSVIDYAPIMLDVSREMYSSYSDSSLLDSFDFDGINKLMGKNLYGRFQFTPNLIMPNFGAAIMMDAEMAFYANNKAMPHITFGWQNTNGIQMGTGFSLYGKRRRPRSGTLQNDIRVGIGGKYLWRRGGYRHVPFEKLLQINKGTSLIKELAGNYHTGMGVDFGLQVIQPLNKGFVMSFGSAYTDVGNTSFGGEPETQMGNFSVGTALKYYRPAFSITGAFDYSNIAQDVEGRQKMHYGVELQLSMLTIYMGINQVYFTTGVGFDVWLLRVMAVTYGQELGTDVFQDGNRRFMLSIDMRAGLF